jgi:putative membrane protein
MNTPQFLAIVFLATAAISTQAASTNNVNQETLSKIHQINQMEIQAAKMALNRGSSDDVKSYAKRLISDHTDADKKVMQVALKDKITIAALPVPSDDQKSMQNLKALTGNDFDIAYQKMMEDGHQKAILMLKDVEPRLDPTMQHLVQGLLPNFEHHEKLAQELKTNDSTLIRTG